MSAKQHNKWNCHVCVCRSTHLYTHLSPLNNCFDFSSKWQNSTTIFLSWSSLFSMLTIPFAIQAANEYRNRLNFEPKTKICWVEMRWQIDRKTNMELHIRYSNNRKYFDCVEGQYFFAVVLTVGWMLLLYRDVWHARFFFPFIYWMHVMNANIVSAHTLILHIIEFKASHSAWKVYFPFFFFWWHITYATCSRWWTANT